MKKRNVILCTAAGVVVVAAAAGVIVMKGKSSGGGMQGGMGGPGGGPGGMGGMQQESQSTVVRAEEPETGSIYLTTELTGTVEPDDVVHVYAKASGDITAVNVKAGDTVTKGQVLFTIDTEQVANAKNSVDSAQVNLQKAQSDLARMQILYDGGDLSEQEYEQYTNAVKTAQLQYNSAKTSYDQQVSYSSVTAPISGKVESCSAEVYDRANMNGELCVISGEGEKKVTFYVTQRMLENLAVGDSLTVEKSGNTYNAVIDEINTMVDDSTGMFKVEAQLADFAQTVKAGSRTELAMLYRLRDMLLSQHAYLTAMTDYTAHGGKSRGSALYTDLTGGVKPFGQLPDTFTFAFDETESPLIQELWFEDGTCRTAWRAPRPIPEDDDFFENVWRSYRETGNID